MGIFLVPIRGSALTKLFHLAQNKNPNPQPRGLLTEVRMNVNAVFQKLGFTTRQQGAWTWSQFPQWGGWWLGLSFRAKAVCLAQSEGKWFVVPVFAGKSVNITLPNGEKYLAVNRQGYPQPYISQRWDRKTEQIGMVVLTLTENGLVVVKDNKRAHGLVTESPRSSLDNPQQPPLTRPIELGTPKHLDPARITAQGGHTPNVRFYAQVNGIPDGFKTITVDEAYEIGDVGTTAALGLLTHKVGSFDPAEWVNWLKKQ